MHFKLLSTFAHEFALLQMCCIHSICILAPGANVSANLIFHPVNNFERSSSFIANLIAPCCS